MSAALFAFIRFTANRCSSLSFRAERSEVEESLKLFTSARWPKEWDTSWRCLDFARHDTKLFYATESVSAGSNSDTACTSTRTLAAESVSAASREIVAVASCGRRKIYVTTASRFPQGSGYTFILPVEIKTAALVRLSLPKLLRCDRRL